MMTVDLIRMLYDYNYWARDLVWDAAEKLSDDDFMKNTEYSWGSIHNQFVMAMSNEWVWFTRLRGETPKALLTPEDYPNRDSIRTKWREIEAQVRGYINAMTKDRLQEEFTYNSLNGNTHSQGVGEVLLHVVNSGTDNCAQIIAMMHLLGAPTIEQGLIFYLRERQESG